MIYQVGNQKILLTASIRRKVSHNGTFNSRKVDDHIMNVFRNDSSSFKKEYLEFNVTGEEAKQATIELLKDYVSGCRGRFFVDADHEKLYWLDVWINGNFLTRKLKLSDYIRLKIDSEEVIRVSGQVEDFYIHFGNDTTLRCNRCITMS
ncbi:MULTISPECIES: hypothetical protein [unclassified Fusibacter]|uniref:hypothetical protein n=1 Tax=unclassified Fusibacter TaxID=2624464 RepID=UPI001011BB50|nr:MULTISPECIES: hypothetical protein [unclassified Fusibacter]MCK8059005.1 hypothetical protein [Fusibacter sp. A2]NPE22416.1 hypothetical protein [Fusibacter sp. A1]RXV60522.1 hypothetical protein DWB64_11260 [Fusibacter sp. A1]